MEEGEGKAKVAPMPRGSQAVLIVQVAKKGSRLNSSGRVVLTLRERPGNRRRGRRTGRGL